MNIRKLIGRTAAFAVLFATSTPATEPDPILISRTFDVSIEDAWSSWTTVDGLQEFFSKKAIVDPRIDGEYSILFFPDNPPGTRGAENMRIVAIEPPQRIMFTWNSPPFFGPVRNQRALVEVFLEDAGKDRTTVTLRHFGWGRGDQWPRIRKYFDGAWRVILERLAYSYANGPIDWDNVPPHLYYSVGPDDI
ncbi:MAG: SRPBCC domain-containing protein [Woeseiaceae bacterium]|nr:SRPBCC domain-containing protein [Woeseiaceae bacterium]